jgi:4-amino-4-deoxy-L-arabinose transferase-like glycosyltransferase
MVAAAFLMRITFLLVQRTYLFPDFHNHFAFGFETGSIAGSIARGEGFSSPFSEATGPTAWIGPIYPYILAAIFRLFGVFSNASAIAILSVNSIFAALTCWPIYEIGKRIFGRTVGLIAGWSWALVPFFFRWAITWVWDPPISAFLLACGVLIALRIEDGNWRHWMGFGVLAGLAALVNPALSTLFPVLMVWTVWKLWRSRQRVIPQLGASLMLMAIVISPWLIRNRVVLGQWVYLRDNAGFEFSLGNFPGSPGVPWSGGHPAVNKRIFNQYREMGELKFIETKHAEAMRWVHAHPDEFMQLTLKRVKDFWDGSELHYEPGSDPWRPWMVALESIPALLGLLFAAVRRFRVGPIALILLIYPLPYYVVYTNPRYRHAIEPLLVILISYFVVALVQEFRGGGLKRSAVKSAAA